jgi:hypothetical protein
MTRKLLVRIIAIFCVAKGLWDLGDFLYPIFFLPPPFPLKIAPLIGGTLEIYAGINLFRLSETGRKVLLTLSYIFTMVITLVILWTLFFWKDGYASAMYYFDEKIFTSESRFVSAGIDFVFLIAPLFMIFFLSQEKTKMLFAREAIVNADSKTSVESA